MAGTENLRERRSVADDRPPPGAEGERRPGALAHAGFNVDSPLQAANPGRFPAGLAGTAGTAAPASPVHVQLGQADTGGAGSTHSLNEFEQDALGAGESENATGFRNVTERIRERRERQKQRAMTYSSGITGSPAMAAGVDEEGFVAAATERKKKDVKYQSNLGNYFERMEKARPDLAVNFRRVDFLLDRLEQYQIKIGGKPIENIVKDGLSRAFTRDGHAMHRLDKKLEKTEDKTGVNMDDLQHALRKLNMAMKSGAPVPATPKSALDHAGPQMRM